MSGPSSPAGDRLAVVDPLGSWRRSDLDRHAAVVASRLAAVAATEGTADPSNVRGGRVVVLGRPGHDVLVSLFAAWRRGALAVPLHPDHPVAELTDRTIDAGATVVVASATFTTTATEVAGAAGVPLVVLPERPADLDAEHDQDDVAEPGTLAHPAAPPVDQDALLVFTSGTTGRPKGVVHTYGSIRAQIDALLGPWGWRDTDRALLVLPLHHVHGLMAVVLCAHAAGAVCEAPGGFDATATWERLGSGEITVFMAVPTIYTRLIARWEDADEATRSRWSDGARRGRLMVSGSAALPVSTLARWRELTGHTLLERYGMTEFGLALSNRLDRRVPGHVGEPLPGYDVRLVDAENRPVGPGESGDLQLRGPALFRAYLDRPEATAEAFVDGWFRTGDVAVHEPDGFRLLGRASVDILKTGGEKVSAIEVEELYREHPALLDVAVVGLDDPEWGQRVALAYVVGPDTGDDAPTDDALRAWGRERAAPAKVPTRYLRVDDLPRNPMGKVLKGAVADRFDAPTPTAPIETITPTDPTEEQP